MGTPPPKRGWSRWEGQHAPSPPSVWSGERSKFPSGIRAGLPPLKSLTFWRYTNEIIIIFIIIILTLGKNNPEGV